MTGTKNWLLMHKGLMAVIVGAAAGGAVVAGVVSRGSTGPPAYLASGSRSVEFITWQPVGSGIQGTIAYDSLTGTAPNETVFVQSVQFTGSISGSTVTMTVNGGFLVGTRTTTATLTGDALSISFVGPSGAIQTSTLTQSSVSAYNAAVALLHRDAHHANVLAEQAQQRQQQARANARQEQNAQNDVTTLQQDASLSAGSSLNGDLASFASDVQSSSSDLKTSQQDAGQSKGFCNASIMVNGDAQALDGDLQAIQGDIQSIQRDMATVREDIRTVNNDVARLSANGLSVPGNAQGAISQARANLRQAVSQANTYIDQANVNDAQGYQVAQGLATARCSGPGNSPAPVPHIP